MRQFAGHYLHLLSSCYLLESSKSPKVQNVLGNRKGTIIRNELKSDGQSEGFDFFLLSLNFVPLFSGTEMAKNERTIFLPSLSLSPRFRALLL